MSSAGPKATTTFGSKPASAARATGEPGAADDRELARRREVEVERAERPAERRRRARQVVADEPQRADRLPLELVVSPDPREPQEDEGEHRVARRDRVVLERLLPRDELLAVGRREEEAAALRVSEERDRALRGAAARAQPAEAGGRARTPAGRRRACRRVRGPGERDHPRARRSACSPDRRSRALCRAELDVRTTRSRSWASSSHGATPPSWSSAETRISSPASKPRPAVRESMKSSEVMFGPKITSCGLAAEEARRARLGRSRICPTRRLVSYTAPRLALASRSVRATASPTSSGTCEPPGHRRR